MAKNNMTTKNYNGWTNYETWLVNLWMDNDENMQGHLRQIAADEIEKAMVNSSDWMDAVEEATQSLASAIQENHEENCTEVTGVFADLLNSALSEVNWDEIAERMVSAAAEEMELSK